MELRDAKELLHIERWLEVVSSIVDGGKAAYDRDPVTQEAGDSLMIKRQRSTLQRVGSPLPLG